VGGEGEGGVGGLSLPLKSHHNGANPASAGKARPARVRTERNGCAGTTSRVDGTADGGVVLKDSDR
jgi:hypothetical protein